MRLSRFALFGLVSCLFFVLMGCSATESPQASGSNEPGPATSDQVPPVTELPYDYAAMEHDVVIRLVEEPRLQSPIRTVVGPEPQAYTLFFREAMDRQSVEKVIREHARGAVGEMNFVEPVWGFHWVHDQQLHLQAELPRPFTKEDSWLEYRIDVTGAKTAKGRSLGEETPDFWAVAIMPQQVWKMSVDGAEREKVTDFSVYYNMNVIGPDSRYLLLSRFTDYCECDALYPKLYSLYDLQEGSLTDYPVELLQVYTGEGDFMADRRGFFYNWPADGGEPPQSEWVSRVQIEAHVYGASFSRDHRHLLMAVGKPEQKQDLDFLLYDLEAGKVVQHLSGAVKGVVPIDELHNTPVPIRFADDGLQATFRMLKTEGDWAELRWRYDWKTGAVTSWNPPVPEDAWSDYVQSDDGMYQLFFGGGLYQGSQLVMEWSGNDGIWLPDSHLLALTRWESDDWSTHALALYDVDRREERVLATGLPFGLRLLNVTDDGKWLYVRTEQELAE